MLSLVEREEEQAKMKGEDRGRYRGPERFLYCSSYVDLGALMHCLIIVGTERSSASFHPSTLARSLPLPK